MGYYRVVRFRSNEEAVGHLQKAKALMESATEMMETACEMLKNGMDERMGERRMRDSEGRFMGRDHMMDERDWSRMDERDWDRMRSRESFNGMPPRSRFDY